ncbi:hypothetical protein GNI_125830 [Gregarina niphandrodes]|uniref:Uncharacterized protein n=1 Tax=Gregarina niphandrodes TaxID=110365 RepID=A0A023B206_GRENI|nr:hypothetical protein GNI_125830 [Gregarina niphandrodes]EZG50490.1 hypothetical protein GNI_125830 [Gregarina niphandrodes]|eukprot:XP_011132012.1 hypothetical protein GNI_125830 [Gregarina niphandrodes]
MSRKIETTPPTIRPLTRIPAPECATVMKTLNDQLKKSSKQDSAGNKVLQELIHLQQRGKITYPLDARLQKIALLINEWEPSLFLPVYTNAPVLVFDGVDLMYNYSLVSGGSPPEPLGLVVVSDWCYKRGSLFQFVFTERDWTSLQSNERIQARKKPIIDKLVQADQIMLTKGECNYLAVREGSQLPETPNSIEDPLYEPLGQVSSKYGRNLSWLNSMLKYVKAIGGYWVSNDLHVKPYASRSGVQQICYYFPDLLTFCLSSDSIPD